MRLRKCVITAAQSCTVWRPGLKQSKEMYAQRKCIVDPVYGQMKHSVFCFDQFSWRGLQNVRNEWSLARAAHNLCKLHRAVLKCPDMRDSPNTFAA